MQAIVHPRRRGAAPGTRRSGALDRAFASVDDAEAIHARIGDRAVAPSANSAADASFRDCEALFAGRNVPARRCGKVVPTTSGTRVTA